MLKQTDDGLDTLRQRGLWAIWFGLIVAMLVSVLLFNNFLGAVRQTLWEGQQRQVYDHWVTDQLDLDYAGLLVAVGNAQVSEQLGAHGAGDAAAQAIVFAHLSDVVAGAEVLSQAAFSDADMSGDLAALLSAQKIFVSTYAARLKQQRDLQPAELQQLHSDVSALVQQRQALAQGVMRSEVQSFEDREATLQSGLQAMYRSGMAVLLFFAGLMAVNVLMAVTLRKRRQALKQSVANMRSIVQASRDAIFLVQKDLTVVGMGRAGEALFGYSEEETLGRSLLDFFANDRTEFEEFVSSLKAGRDDPLADFSIELNARRRDGTVFAANTSFAASEGGSDDIAYIIAVSDMTEQIERELSLMQARNEALQAERAKSRFLASMSHEMRTPLNGVLASLDLLRETTRLDDRQCELVSIIERSGDDALEQVDNVLELTRLDTLANTAIAVAPFCPVAELHKIVEAARPRAVQNKNELQLETQLPETLQVVGSAILFRQIMHNFLSNAVKFTSEGRVVARLSALDMGEAFEFTAVVEDTGIGIETVDLDRIFRNFETIRDSYSHFSSGSGLGLSIAKHSADLLNASIEVESHPGQGSSFSLVVRWNKVAEDVASPPLTGHALQQDSDGGLDVLVVEDNEINRQMLVEMLKTKGHRVVQAVDGLEGVAAGRDQAFDLILMDISMPKLDGVGATRMLRHMGESREAPIVAVTAHSQPEHMREFLAAGMDRVLTKPLRMATLDALFEDLGMAPKASASACEGMATKVETPAIVSIEKGQNVAAEAPVEAVEPVVAASQAEDAFADVAVLGVIEESEETTTEEETMTEQLIDKEVFDGLIDMLGGESVVGYLAQFENDAVEMLPKYDAAIASSDFATARAEAHRCAGGAAVIGAGRVHEVLQGMTHSADDGDAASCNQMSASLLDLTRRTMTEMRGVIG
ncbi:response regulator [Thalassobius sp. Cn5-15]|uniref:hybrid sensor histidine kinase/response regulator n=1 Tax=Thalassobius sp. Cn5-15 TaxID=2917763 RepID=UPI001EF3430D|nr:response regulator [Thalassobius sp. Cn5-15]MCG7492759.1 response regulator [Thalassobius sp. Cn5-15]